MRNDNEIKVFISDRDSQCSECKQELGSHAWIFLNKDKGALCLSCADLDHLVFLPSGSHALTLRAKKHSKLYAVVLKWSKARKQYERQGLLVEEEALAKAELECGNDEKKRELSRAIAAEYRAELDAVYAKEFGKKVREVFPFLPAGRETVIAEHACRKYSGRIGRSVAAKAFDESSVHLAVTAHARHTETEYDELLLKGHERYDARESIGSKLDRILNKWESGN